MKIIYYSIEMNDSDKQTGKAISLAEYIDKVLEERGFVPTAASVLRPNHSTFVVIKSNGDKVILKENRMQKIIRGGEHADPDVSSVLKVWYPRSLYKLENALKYYKEQWKNETDLKLKIQYASKINKIKNEDFIKQIKMRELEFVYGVSGKKLEELYLIKYGLFDCETIKVGVFDVKIPLRFFKESMLRREYPSRESKGGSIITNDFFEDFRNASKVINLLMENYDDELNEFEKEALHNSSAKGREEILVQKGEDVDDLDLIAMEGRVGINQTIGTVVKIKLPERLNKEKFQTALDKNYTDVIKSNGLLPKDGNNTFHFLMKKNGLVGSYIGLNLPELFLAGNLDLLEEVTISMIYAVVNY